MIGARRTRLRRLLCHFWIATVIAVGDDDRTRSHGEQHVAEVLRMDQSDDLELLRRLALNDDHVLPVIMGTPMRDHATRELDYKVRALLRLAALIASGSSAIASYNSAVSMARAAGTSDAGIIEVLCSIAPIVGSARTVAAAPPLASALGLEVDPLSEC